jgi:hypothetical protein
MRFPFLLFGSILAFLVEGSVDSLSSVSEDKLKQSKSSSTVESPNSPSSDRLVSVELYDEEQQERSSTLLEENVDGPRIGTRALVLGSLGCFAIICAGIVLIVH